MESEAAAALSYTQARSLYQTMTGIDANGNQIMITITEKDGKSTHVPTTNTLQTMIHQAYTDAKNLFDKRQNAYNLVVNQVNLATIKLNKAQVKLKSLQTGLSAGNAAAMVS